MTNFTEIQLTFIASLEESFKADPFIGMLSESTLKGFAGGFALTMPVERQITFATEDTIESLKREGSDYFQTYGRSATKLFPLGFLTPEFKSYLLDVAAGVAVRLVEEKLTK